jgi:hypothetical protein
VARDRSEVVLAAVNVAACAGALLALAAGAPAHRLRPLAVFSGLGAAAALYVEVAKAFARRRARAQAASSPPRGVRLHKPLWLSAIDGATMALLATPLAALAGVAGFTSVGVGVLITAGALLVTGFAVAGNFDTSALTFEDGGLRVHARAATFLIRWDAIVDVTRDGPEGRLVRLRFAGTEAVLGSVVPATDRARSRASFLIGGRGEPASEMTFASWTAGLDASALSRALAAARAGEPSLAN